MCVSRVRLVRVAFCAFRVLGVCVLGVLRFGALCRVSGLRSAGGASEPTSVHCVRFGNLRLRSGSCVLLNILRFPADQWWILVLRHLVTIVRKSATTESMASGSAGGASEPTSFTPTMVDVRLFAEGGKSKWWRFAQEVSCLGDENLRCGAFAF